MRKIIVALALSIFMLPALPAAVLAQGHDDHWHGDIHRFHERDFDQWREGHWFHGPHDGRDGWWWMIGDSWYFYPQPVYPYPDPYVPPTIAIAPTPPGPMPAAYWYYCRNPQGYYPYVPECFVRWRRVAATVPPQTVIVQQQPPVMVQQPAPMPQMAPAPASVPQSLSIRDQDDRQLNMFGVEFSQTNPKNPYAAEHLKDLKKRVEAYRQTLFTRNYNAMDLLKDTEALEQRISAERSAILKKPVAATPVPVPSDGGSIPPPPPGNPPPMTGPPTSTTH
jgi:hypothetical protein